MFIKILLLLPWCEAHLTPQEASEEPSNEADAKREGNAKEALPVRAVHADVFMVDVVGVQHN
eukprot:12501444-Alexandrium_andersonii.AAC.1